jgi:predicted NBD/HSP70 family sugar kinase
MAGYSAEEFEGLLARSSLGAASAATGPEVPSELAHRAVRRAEEFGRVRAAVGIELLPYLLVGAVTDERGRRVADAQRRLTAMNVRHVARAAAALIIDLLMMADIPVDPARVAAGLQLGGPVDSKTGTVLFYHKSLGDSAKRSSFAWRNEPLKQMLQDATGLPVVIENDGNAFAVYHHWFGAGRAVPRFAAIVVREGVGAGVIINDELLDVPAEIGQLVAEDYGDKCDCGRRGCLETVAGIRGIVRRVSDQVGWPVDGIVAAAELASGYDGDAAEKALEPFSAAGKIIARAIGIMFNMYNPTRLVLCVPPVMAESGTPAANAFLARATNTRSVTHPAFRKHEVVVRPIGPYDGAHGVALIALNRCLGILPEAPISGPQLRS